MILLSLYLTLALFDACYTTRMLEQYGTAIELNPMIPFLAKHTNVATGTWLGIMVPSLLIGALGVFFPAVLDIMLPLRSLLCGMQLARLKDKWLFPRKIRIS